jgi:ribose transport system ATP-binding protein
MRGVVKRFGPTVALGGVDLEVSRGEVHALIGENGAGKSTLMKVLSGAHLPDEGEIRIDGEPYAPAGPLEGRAAGVGMIYQELNLAPDLSVEANVLLGAEVSKWGIVRFREHERRVREALEILGRADIHPRTIVGDLSIGARQLVEIARALTSDARIIVLDEPTSSLTLSDAERLFEIIERLKKSGVAVIYISHFLEEVFRIADRYTVLRNGETVGSGEIADVTTDDIIELMVGRSLAELFPSVPHERGEPLLTLDDLLGHGLTRPISLTLHHGEILGIAGLVGAGRTELLRAIFGLDPILSGTVTISGVTTRHQRPDRRLRQGFGFVSENRKEEGLSLSQSIADNVTMSDMRSISKWGWIAPATQHRRVRQFIEKVKIKCRGPGQPVEDLSGGNQQKVAIARLLHQEADVLLLDEPTRGIDVGSKAEVYRLMNELAAAGKGVLFVSSYVPELLGVCDRIAVLSRGELVAIRETRDWSEHDILLAATGGEQAV